MLKLSLWCCWVEMPFGVASSRLNASAVDGASASFDGMYQLALWAPLSSLRGWETLDPPAGEESGCDGNRKKSTIYTPSLCVLIYRCVYLLELDRDIGLYFVRRTTIENRLLPLASYRVEQNHIHMVRHCRVVSSPWMVLIENCSSSYPRKHCMLTSPPTGCQRSARSAYIGERGSRWSTELYYQKKPH